VCLTGTESVFTGLPVKKYCLIINMCCCILSFFCVAANAKTQGTPAELKELLGQLEKQHGGVKTLAVRFRQEKHFSFMNKPIVSRGFIIFSSPDKIRFDITEPFATTLLDNGKKIERYELVDGKWRRIQFNGGNSIKLVMKQIGQWMQGKFSGQKNIFALSMNIEEPNNGIFLDLEPRHKQFRQYIEKIRVGISAGPAYNISRIDIYEPGGDRFALDFVRKKVNQKLPEDCFSDPNSATACEELFLKAKRKE